MLSDTDSMNIFNACSLIECTTHDKDKNAINLKSIDCCKNVGRLFPRHNNIIFILFGRQEPSFKIWLNQSGHLFIYSVIHSIQTTPRGRSLYEYNYC